MPVPNPAGARRYGAGSERYRRGSWRRAARPIGSGELEFARPPSRVSEVAGAFTAMGDACAKPCSGKRKPSRSGAYSPASSRMTCPTPLFALRGYLEALRKGIADSPEKVAHYVAVCEEQSSQIDRLATDVFNCARLQYVDQIPRSECLDLGELLCQLADGEQPQADTKGGGR
jgi:hypothetical protein